MNLREKYARQIILEVEEGRITEDLISCLEETLKNAEPGETEIRLACVSEHSTAMFSFDGKRCVLFTKKHHKFCIF